MRHKARELALKMIFQMDVGKNDIQTAGITLDESGLPPEAKAFAMELTCGICANREAIDEIIVRHVSGWSLERMSNVDRNVLRIALFELTRLKQLPCAVIIDEAIELAKEYGTEASGAFVNGVLDACARTEDLDERSVHRD